MLYRLMKRVSRFVLTAMLITFLSPAHAWQGLATHDELEHAAASAGAAHTHGDSSHRSHDEPEAHDFIGHVLGHLPACLSATLTVPLSPAAASLGVYVAVDWPAVNPEPPLRPPRFS